MKSREDGFSLIELLIAVSIMLILGGIVAVNLVAEPGKARVARAKSDIETLKTAVRLYQNDNFAIPTQRQGLVVLVSRPAANANNWREGGYLDSTSLPKDPWGNDYVYFAPGRQKEAFEIVSFGADGQPGGEGEAADISSSRIDGQARQGAK